MTQLTQKDMQTLSLALNYAVAERESFVDATRGCDDKYHKRAVQLVKDFEKLHKKVFGTNTQHFRQREADNALPSVSIHDLKERRND